MPSAVDANVLLGLTQRTHAKHAVARSAIRKMILQGELLHILPQNVTEFWGVATRPAAARGGFGKTPVEADRQTRLLEKLFVLLPDTPAIYQSIWNGGGWSSPIAFRAYRDMTHGSRRPCASMASTGY